MDLSMEIHWMITIFPYVLVHTDIDDHEASFF